MLTFFPLSLPFPLVQVVWIHPLGPDAIHGSLGRWMVTLGAELYQCFRSLRGLYTFTWTYGCGGLSPCQVSGFQARRDLLIDLHLDLVL
jgi:hypothetical protein